MQLTVTLSVALSALCTAAAAHSSPHHGGAPSCRFALEWSTKDILKNPEGFASDLLYWEGKFHQNNVSYNQANGMSYDGTQLDWVTGKRTKKHPFSAASKESMQIMLYARAVEGNALAARFLSPDEPSDAPGMAVKIMENKLKTYLKFNSTFPGFGGFLPWMTTSTTEVTPTYDWVNRVPALDNGELIWAVYAFIQALENTKDARNHHLAASWQRWLDYTKTTAARVFYRGKGVVCAVTTVKNQTYQIDDPRQGYKCEGTGVLNDPYEGELFAWWLDLFANLGKREVDSIWEVKRPQLVQDEYKMGGIGPITVQEGYWFSSHEQWKVLEMPYYDIPLVKRLFLNAERARTCNSVVKKIPGLYASVNNSTDPKTDEIIGYISPAGIPSIANQTEQYLDVITPYGAWPTILLDKAVGLAWWRNMAAGKKMQNPYGSTESTRIDGELVSALVTWDSKVLSVLALMGGVTDLVRQKMRTDGIYDQFVKRTTDEHSRVFRHLKGEHISLCLPEEKVPDAGLKDFTLCS